MFTQEITQVFSIAQNMVSGSPKGVSAVLIKLTDNWAIKLFKYNRDRDMAYDLQTLYASHELGPSVGEKLDLPEPIKNNHHEYKYGYFTEIVETVTMGNSGELTKEQRIERMNQQEAFYLVWGSEYNRDSKLYEEIIKWREITGYLMSDMHTGNLGWKNGKLIPIDFGCV